MLYTIQSYAPDDAEHVFDAKSKSIEKFTLFHMQTAL